MGMTQETLQIVVGIVGGLIIVTRLYGVIKPGPVKDIGAKLARLGKGWIRTFYVIIGLVGIWILYSALAIIFSHVPVFLVLGLLIGLLLVLSGAFVFHPEWFPRVVKGLLVDRGEFFVRVLCFIGVLVGVFILLAAIFGPNWGGS